MSKIKVYEILAELEDPIGERHWIDETVKAYSEDQAFDFFCMDAQAGEVIKDLFICRVS